jgi:hypothetical protein
MTEDALIKKVSVVLQSCTISEDILLDSCEEGSVTSPNSPHEVVSIKVEEGIDVNKQEMFPVPISFPRIKAEQDEVSYMSLHRFLDTFCQYPEMPAVLYYLQLSICPKLLVMNENFVLFWVM